MKDKLANTKGLYYGIDVLPNKNMLVTSRNTSKEPNCIILGGSGMGGQYCHKLPGKNPKE